jgi:hypothetical protein
MDPHALDRFIDSRRANQVMPALSTAKRVDAGVAPVPRAATHRPDPDTQSHIG